MLPNIIFNSKGDWKSQQTQICVNIRMMQNRKYNDAVYFMQTTGPAFLKSMDDIAQLRFGSNRLGDMNAVANDSMRTANEMNATIKNFEADQGIRRLHRCDGGQSEGRGPVCAQGRSNQDRHQ